MVFFRDLERCPLEAKEEKTERKVEEAVASETMKLVTSTIRRAYDVLSKLNETLVELTSSFDKDDLVALIAGKRRLPKKTVKAVLDAIEKARTVGKRYALIKFVSVMGNIPLRDVAVVLNEIEKLNEKYVKKEEIRKIFLEAEGEEP